MDKLSNEKTKAIFTKKTPQDNRPFFQRLLSSIRPWSGEAKTKDGRRVKWTGIQGGTDF
jgi:hypothetical protein